MSADDQYGKPVPDTDSGAHDLEDMHTVALTPDAFEAYCCKVAEELWDEAQEGRTWDDLGLVREQSSCTTFVEGINGGQYAALDGDEGMAEQLRQANRILQDAASLIGGNWVDEVGSSK